MKKKAGPFVAKYLGSIPNRLQLAGGWIDKPFVSKRLFVLMGSRTWRPTPLRQSREE